jgi:hypothetical protein
MREENTGRLAAASSLLKSARRPSSSAKAAALRDFDLGGNIIISGSEYSKESTQHSAISIQSEELGNRQDIPREAR